MSRIESPDNRVLQEDLERAAALDLPIEALDGSRIFDRCNGTDRLTAR